MNTRQKNKLDAYTATEAVLRSTPEVAGVPGLPAKLEAFSRRIAELHALGCTQSEPPGVSVARREMLFAAMAALTIEIAGAVMIVARDRRRSDLAEAVLFRRSALQRNRPAERIWLAHRVHETALSVLDGLAPYGVTAERLAELQARIEAAAEGAGTMRTAVTARRAATEGLRELFRDTDAMLRMELDPLVERLRPTQPQAFASYRAAREIVHRRGSRATGAESPAVVPTPEVATPPGLAS